ncbi:hypothetical protein GGR62_000061 [Xanthomonas campestris]|nr:hypothetical protein [Xanthomonas sp. 3075]
MCFDTLHADGRPDPDALHAACQSSQGAHGWEPRGFDRNAIGIGEQIHTQAPADVV